MRTVVVVVVVDRGSRKKKESMSNAGGVVESEGLLPKGSTAIMNVVQRSKRNVRLSSFGGPRIRCPALGIPMAQNGADGADGMAQISIPY